MDRVARRRPGVLSNSAKADDAKAQDILLDYCAELTGTPIRELG